MKDKLKQEIDAYLEEVVPIIVDKKLDEQRLKELEQEHISTCVEMQLKHLKDTVAPPISDHRPWRLISPWMLGR